MKKILIFLVSVIFLITNVVTAYSDSWWSPDWKYAKIINISENSGNDLLNYQILIKIDYEQFMRPDFSDLRFIYFDSAVKVKLPYWIEEKKDGNYSNVWIKLPFIQKNYTFIKMYYGNENAQSESDGSQVFDKFDDFINLSQWQIREKSPNSNISISTDYSKTGNTSVRIYGDPDGWAVLKRIDIPYGSYIYEIYFYDTQKYFPENQMQSFETDADEPDGQCKYVDVGYFEYYNSKNYTVRFSEVCYPDYKYDTNVPSTKDWHLFGIYWNGSNYFIYIDNQLVSKSPDGWPPGSLHPLRSSFGDWWKYVKSDFYWDTYKIRKYVYPEPTYTISEAIPYEPPEPEVPKPTERSLIITTPETKDVLSSVATGVPVLVADSLTPEIQKFIGEYQPDYIYTVGFSAGLGNSYEIKYYEIPQLFFPDATQAVYAQDREKAILGSNLARYLNVPLIFEHDPRYEEIDIESKTPDEIQELYVSKLVESGDDTNYLILANPETDDGLLAGYLAGIRHGYVIPVYSSDDAASIKEKIKSAANRLRANGLFSGSLNYKKGGPLYLAIMGGRDAIPFCEFQDPAFEMINNKDGDTLYSDIPYGDIHDDGTHDLSVGRLDGGAAAISLHLARQRLARSEKITLVGEYRHGKLADALHFYGGMFQAWFIDNAGLKGFETSRIVEKRIDFPGTDAKTVDLVKMVYDIAKDVTIDKLMQVLLGGTWSVFSYAKMANSVAYGILEFDWIPWLQHPGGFPDHLPVINASLNDKISGAGVVGYFGMGDKYWSIPHESRNWLEMYLDPYGNSTNFTSISFDGFLYDDHDISAESEIKKQVVEQGGSVLASSGIVHDTYTTISSSSFFSGLAEGASLGEALSHMINNYPSGQWAAIIFPSASFTKGPALGLKDIAERILYADPAYVPFASAKKALQSTQPVAIAPSGSFTISAALVSNYTVENRSLKVWNADSYMVEQERPLVPVFVKEFILPTGASIEKVKADIKYSTVRGLARNIIYNDTYYADYAGIMSQCMQDLNIVTEPNDEEEVKLSECVKAGLESSMTYPYPNESYWFRSSTLLDGRISVRVYIPSVIYEQRTSKVVQTAQISVEYDAKLEMRVETQDVPAGEEAAVKVTMLNQGGEIAGDVYVWIEGDEGTWNFSESVNVPENSTLSRKFSFTPPSKGGYQVKALFDASGVTIGPRFASFTIGEIEFDVSKKFWPVEVALRFKKYWPPVNFPEIRIENAGAINITSVAIEDTLPDNFYIPGRRYSRNVQVDGETFEADDKIQVFVFLISGDKDAYRHWPFGKKVRMLGRQYYNATFAGHKLFIKIADLSRTNVGRNLGKNDRLMIKYIMLSDKVLKPGNMTTQTTVSAFSGGTYTEKTIMTELVVK